MTHKLQIFTLLIGFTLSSCSLIKPISSSSVTSQTSLESSESASTLSSESSQTEPKSSSIVSSETSSLSSQHITSEDPKQDYSAQIYEISDSYPLGKLIKVISFNDENKVEKLLYIKNQLPNNDNYYHYQWNGEFPSELPSSNVSFYYSKILTLYHINVEVYAYDNTPIAYTTKDSDLPYGTKTGFDYEVGEEDGYIFMGFFEGTTLIDDMGYSDRYFYTVTHDATITAHFLKVMFDSSTLDIYYSYLYNEHRITVYIEVKEDFRGTMRVPFGEELTVPNEYYDFGGYNFAYFTFETEGYDPNIKVLDGNIEAMPL